MQLHPRYFLALSLLVASCLVGATERKSNPSPNGIAFPNDYRQWEALAVSHRTDNQSLRLILGNDIAIKAKQQGNTKPWPDGSMLGKIVWKDSQHPQWDAATVPGALKHLELMLKDSQRFKDTGGWGFARWLGQKKKPYGKSADFAKECYQCHLKAKTTDIVFSKPVKLP